MKVTVNFGSVRVIVPCGTGDILVRDLVQLAITRYKKACGKPQDAWVTVHNVKSYNDGGILDPDDRLNDVVDDREQIVAEFEEQTSPYPAHNAGDGTSASSVGTESPDIFRRDDINGNELGTEENSSYVEVEIAGDKLPLGVAPLQVRRGSEPTLNRLSPVPPEPDPTKRWSAAVVVDDPPRPPGEYDHSLDGESRLPLDGRGEGSGEEKRGTLSRIARGSGRLSILGSGANAYRWAEAADRQLFKMEDGRREPLGGTGSSPSGDGEVSCADDDRESVIALKNEAGPLGIHVVPEQGTGGRDMGLVIQGIEPGGRIDRDGRLQVGDTIVEVNGRSLLHVSFQDAQEVFKNALRSPEIVLRVSGSRRSPEPRPPPPPLVPSRESPRRPPPTLPKPTEPGKVVDGLVEGEERGLHSKVATVSPTKKVPPSSGRPPSAPLSAANTRKMGRKVHIKLVKGPEGLGFSVTTRDNPAGGNCPIYIKNILPHGAAIDDGRLRPGDRLLEVNGIEMTGKTQADAVSILRNAPPGSTVELVVSRQEPDPSPSPSLPREMPQEKAEDEVGIFPWRNKEILTFDIPLNDTGSAGLGVSVKGKTSTGSNGPVDLGIFVKSVIHGGAASKDGRLQMNDQLLNVNGISLLGRTNAQAMETLRRAMTRAEGPNPNAITLTVARRIPSADAAENLGFEEGFLSSGDSCSMHLRSDSLLSSDSSANTAPSSSCENLSPSGNRTPDHSTSGNSENTVVYVPRRAPMQEPTYGRNPVISRLMGQGTGGSPLSPAPGALRNESYLRASHESWVGSRQGPLPGGEPRRPPPLSPDSGRTSGEAVIIDEDYPSAIVGGDDRVPPATPLREEVPPVPCDGSALDVGDLSLADGNFCRDGFGRQSISEKRHAQLDARNTDTYKRNKRTREEQAARQQDDTEVKLPHGASPPPPARPLRHAPVEGTAGSEKSRRTANPTNLTRSNSADSLVDRSKSVAQLPPHSLLANGESPGTDSSCVTSNTTVTKSNNSSGLTQQQSTLGLRKSSSLESLRTREEGSGVPSDGRGSAAAVRGGRGCNESFRAAVDRSYEVEEESESGGSTGGVDQRLPCPVHPEDAPESPKKGAKVPQRKKGLLKGLGSVFSRFGKNRKTIPEPGSKIPREEPDREGERDEHDVLREQYRRLTEQQNHRPYGQQKTSQVGQQQQQKEAQPPTSGRPLANGQGGSSRQERMQQLRAQHQKKHVERQCHYPRDDLEEWYERDLQQKMRSPASPQCRPLPPVPGPPTLIYGTYGYSRRVLPKVCSPQRNGSFGRSFSLRTPRSLQRRDGEMVHPRSPSFDIFKEMERPGSRVGLADPTQYSHYVNFNEIQMHLRQFQQQNQPPVQPPRQSERPASNYYEYESIRHVQPQLQNGVADSNSGSLPRHAHVAGHRTVYAKVISSGTQHGGALGAASPGRRTPGYGGGSRHEPGRQMPGSKV